MIKSLLVAAAVLSASPFMFQEKVPYVTVPASAEQLVAIGIPPVHANKYSGRTASDLQEKLSKKYSELDAAVFKNLKKLLRTDLPDGIAGCNKRAYAVFGGPTAGNRSWWRLLMPLRKQQRDGAFAMFRDPEAKAIVRGWSGVRDTICSDSDVDVAGAFEELPELASHFADFEESRREWRNMYVVFHAVNGDLLLCSSDGKAGWFVLELDEYKHAGHIKDLAPHFLTAIQAEGHLSYWSLKEVLDE